MSSCPICGSMLFWGDKVTENSQDCFCFNCGKHWVASFDKEDKELKINGFVI